MAGHQGGKGKCSVCAHPNQAEVNEELARQVPLRTIGKRWELDKQALSNHRRNHLSPALLALHKAKGATPVLEELFEVRDNAALMYEAARAVRNMPLALASNRQWHEILQTIAKVTGEMDERPQVTVNIQNSAAYIAIRTVIFDALENYPEVRSEISRKLRLLAANAEASGAA